jgi:hypothetical protein
MAEAAEANLKSGRLSWFQVNPLLLNTLDGLAQQPPNQMFQTPEYHQNKPQSVSA